MIDPHRPPDGEAATSVDPTPVESSVATDSQAREWGRRRLLATVALGLTSGLAGCNNSDDGRTDTGTPSQSLDGRPNSLEEPLTMVTGGLGGVGPLIERWRSAYESTSGNELRWHNLPVDSVEDRMLEWARADSPPDVADVENWLMAPLSAMGTIADLRERLPETVLERYEQETLDRFADDDGLYGIPFYQTTTFAFARRTWLDAAGIDGPPSSTTELLDTAESIGTETDASFGLTFVPSNYALWTLFAGEGIDIVDETGTTVAFDTDRTVSLLERLVGQTAAGLIPMDTWKRGEVAAAKRFASGDTGLLLGWSATLPLVAYYGNWPSADSLAVDALPRSTRLAHVWTVGVSRSDARKAAATDLVGLLQSNNRQAELVKRLPVFAGTKTANEVLLTDVAYDQFWAEHPIRHRLQERWVEADTGYYDPPRHPQTPRIWEAIRAEFSAAALGSKSASDAVTAAAAQVDELLTSS